MGIQYVCFVEAVALLSWLIKDVGWILLLWPIAFLGAVTAFLLQAFLLIQTPKWAPQTTAAVQLQSLATFLWLCGNAVWMVHEFLYDGTEGHLVSGRRFPWYQNPLLDFNAGAYERGVAVTQMIYLASIVLLILTYAGLHFQHLPYQDNTRRHAVLIWGIFPPEIYLDLFIAPWTAKDFFWSLGSIWPTLFCSAAVLCSHLIAFGDTRSSAILRKCAGQLATPFGSSLSLG